ncbi:Retrovirus-related Pol polyprotein from type-1 retrotransposable element R2 [Frankliniella fusca]|uniref:Retrovirus-related Pol polyprotein from type-1 retrotransposable element R2 n=1 Tax=Frankliniella fusca TaxID=407009 RepID=A0AAE1LI14_9NEOP|nr:Retrovirus-related Pol polyprotein from type-1 retrotransposable element R2 [Frankliniella fusca]
MRSCAENPGALVCPYSNKISLQLVAITSSVLLSLKVALNGTGTRLHWLNILLSILASYSSVPNLAFISPQIMNYEALQQQGFETVVDAVVVGSLGSWDPSNESSMALLGIPEKRRKTVKKLIISDVIRWSRDIYVEHVSRARQYKEDVVLPKL